jgi:predicted transposase YbfD/YdcC
MTEKAFTDFNSIIEEFSDLEDPRSTINRRHLLGDLIVISIMAVIAGSDGPMAIATWAENQEEWLKQHLELPNGIPSHDTFDRMLRTIKPEAFQPCFQSWITRISEQHGLSETNQIAIDGKALRRSHDKGRSLGPLFLVSAWAVEHGLSLGQLATEEKSNEITAIPELLDQIEIKNSVVTIDAAGCQKNIAAKIISNKGDYVIAVKANQELLHNAMQKRFFEMIESDFRNQIVETLQEDSKGHGREDNVTYYQMPVADDLATKEKWKGLKTIGVAIRISEHGGKTTSDVRYYICSLPLNVKNFSKFVRGHWAIENTLHWCLDVTFREDECRVRNRNSANNLAWLKRFALSLLKQQKDKHSVAMRRRIAGWNLSYLAQVLGIPTV